MVNEEHRNNTMLWRTHREFRLELRAIAALRTITVAFFIKHIRSLGRYSHAAQKKNENDEKNSQVNYNGCSSYVVVRCCCLLFFFRVRKKA